MTSTIKVNTITTESGSTLTVGGCGKTVALASGASQTGFGRTGTVDWQTTKKTLAFTAANGEGYFVDTAASGAVTMTLPASPSAGNIVGVKDYNGNFSIANLTIARNGSPINGGNAADVVVDTAGASIFLVYVDATQGWVATQDDSSTFSGQAFITATGGTTSTCGKCKIHTFTGPGTFTVSQVASCAANNIVSYLVVAGGGGGGATAGGSFAAGGGGAGGFRELKNPSNPYTASPLDGYSTPGNRITVTATGFPIAVGGGGAAGPYPCGTATGTSGVNSTFSTISSAGGGGGGAGAGPGSNGVNGGSGGGSGTNPSSPRTGGSGNTPSVTPAQGKDGGDSGGGHQPAASGGGATGCGVDSVPGGGNPRTGGAGAATSITSSPVTYSTGGGTASWPGGTGAAGADNTGNGGQGGGGATSCGTSGAGGSGIVIIRYKSQA